MLNCRESEEIAISEDLPSQSTKESRFNICIKHADYIFIGIIALYIIILITFIVILTFSQSIRYQFYGLLDDNYEANTYYGSLTIAAVEFILIMSGFDIFVVDMIVGFVVKPYFYAVCLLFAAKFIGKYLSFLIVRIWLKQEIYDLFRNHLFFKTFYLAAQNNPIQILILLQIITLPTIFKTYGVGAFQVSGCQYASVTFVSNFLWTALFVYLGAQVKSIKIYLETGQTKDLLPSQIQIGITALTLFGLIYLLKLTKDIYKKLEKEAQAE